MGRQSKYPEEFRRKAAALVLDSGRSTPDVGRELRVNHETLRNWVQVLRPPEQQRSMRHAPVPGCLHASDAPQAEPRHGRRQATTPVLHAYQNVR
jgi:transposase-like protein